MFLPQRCQNHHSDDILQLDTAQSKPHSDAEELTTGPRSRLLVNFPDAQWDEQRGLQLDRLKQHGMQPTKAELSILFAAACEAAFDVTVN